MSEGPDLPPFSRLESKSVEKALGPWGQQTEHGPAVYPDSKHNQQHPIQPTQPGGAFLEWLLKIKARRAKYLILITYSFNLLRKRNAGRDAGKGISLFLKINKKNIQPSC